ncbi:hypothetical protein [Brachyspira pilosicoli]|uniref:hypothetical protein n=1 Tax=Brachyspira pilosicoli TaxID=52584 RepID=UPI001CA5EB3C|nr:hypothetical protein [Brachyspira pilosicoli]MBW5397296.1 hypothetical protein [Brachyspira pilosicoli]
MNKPPTRKFKNYNKKLVKIILDNIDDDDYFYNKKVNWEDWVIMRVDVDNAIKRLNFDTSIEYSAMLLEDILYVLKEY